MSTLISNLNTIESIKLDIKSAIEAKGVSMSGVSFPDYPSAIASISGGGGGGGDYTINDIAQRTYRSITNLNISTTSVALYAFAECTLLTVSLPNCTYIDSNTFTMCYSLTTVNLPVCSYIGDMAFYLDNSLTSVSLPVCEYLGNFAFGDCTQLESINLPVCSYIGQYAFGTFNPPIAFSQITLGSTSVCTLDTDAFADSPIANGTGSIFVPASLVSDYQVAENWSVYSSQIFPIPE